MIEGHGSDLYKYGNKIIADFSSNVWPQGTNDLIIDQIKSKLERIKHYPEPNAESLTQNLAGFLSLSAKNILVTNGSAEAFYLTAQCFKNCKSLIAIPSFSEYKDACVVHDHLVEYTTFENLSKNIDSSINLIWLGNPNNPNGRIIPKEVILNLCNEHPDKVFIIDEAYSELCIDFESLTSYSNQFENLIIIRSLTKTFAIPGIRLGFIVSSEKTIDGITKFKIPWSVNSLAIEAGNFIINNYQKLLPKKEYLINESRYLQKELSETNGIEVFNSDCNFFLARLKKGKAKNLKEFLVNEYGLLIRDASNFKGLNESYFRIAAQDHELNNLLIKGIKHWIKAKYE